MYKSPETSTYECHCCGSKRTTYLQHYVLRRSLAVAALYHCESCKSVSVNHDAVRRHYPKSNSKDAIEFHKRIRERNEKWSASLLSQLGVNAETGSKVETLIDIGCGTGTLLSVAAKRGITAIGYEVDPLALAEARLDKRLQIHSELFSSESKAHSDALVCCIAVLEHLYRPALLLNEISKYCIKNSASAFVVVPTLPNEWKHFLEESVFASGNPFFDNEEHISHFTNDALAGLWRDAFGREPKIVTAGGWQGLYFGYTAT